MKAQLCSGGALDVGPPCQHAVRTPAETVMYSAGRQGQTDQLNLANAGLEEADP